MYERERHKTPFEPWVAELMRLVGSKKRSCTVVYTDPTPSRLLSYWEDGSRDEYVCFDKHRQRKHIPVGGHPYFERGDECPLYEPEVGDILVRLGTFCGKPSWPSFTIYVDEQEWQREEQEGCASWDTWDEPVDWSEQDAYAAASERIQNIIDEY